MPPTRRRGGSASSASRNAQSTLTFGAKTRVTKPTAKELAKTTKTEEVISEPEVEEITTTDVPIRQQKVEPVKTPRSEEDVQAERVNEAQVERYWKAEERKRKAPRVHQDGLSLHEKVLRHFDLSSQYGPCIGISRTKRWKRANRLNMHPPIEVLAVLLKEDKKENVKAQTAYMDQLLSSRYVAE